MPRTKLLGGLSFALVLLVMAVFVAFTRDTSQSSPADPGKPIAARRSPPGTPAAEDVPAAAPIDVTKSRSVEPDPAIRLHGTVADAATEVAVAGAVVVARRSRTDSDPPELSQAGDVDAQTDADGAFSMAIHADLHYWAECRADGYATERKDVPSTHEAEDRVDFLLHPGVSISGQVTDAQTGDAVPGADVRATSSQENVWWSSGGEMARTGADGAYMITGVRLGSHRVTVDARRVGYLFRPEQARTLHAEPGRIYSGVDFQLDRGAVVKGILTNHVGSVVTRAAIRARDAQPIEAALKSIEILDTGRYLVPEHRTDDAGMFEVVGLEFERPYRLIIEATGYAVFSSSVFSIGPGESPLEMNLVITPGSTVSGTAYYADGEPASYCRIKLVIDMRALSTGITPSFEIATTAENGTFRFERVSAGAYMLGASIAEAYRTLGDTHALPVEVDGVNDVAGIEIVIADESEQEGEGTIDGVVLDMAGEPVPRVPVMAARSDEPAQTAYVRTGADGKFRFEKLNGLAFDVSVTSDEGAASEEDVPVGSTITLRLAKPTRVSGAVSALDGQPVAACTVRLERLDHDETANPIASMLEEIGRPRTEQTDAAGQFEFLNVPSGRYRVTAQSSADGTGESSPFQMAPGVEVVGLRVVLEPGVRFGGIVENAEAEPVSGATVQLAQTEPGSIIDMASPFFMSLGTRQLAGTATSGPDGRFEIVNVPPGMYAVTAAHRSYARAQETGVTITAGRDVSNYRIVLPRGASAEGRLVIDGEPQAGRLVLFVGPNGIHMTSTGGDGSYDLENVSPGEYVVAAANMNQVFREGPLELLRQQFHVVDLAEGEHRALELGAPDGIPIVGGLTAEGLGNVTGLSLRRPGGPSVADVDLSDLRSVRPLLDVVEMVHRQAGQTFLQEDGTFQFDAIEPGTYILEVFSADIDLNSWDLGALLSVNLDPWLRQEVTVGDQPMTLDLAIGEETE